MVVAAGAMVAMVAEGLTVASGLIVKWVGSMS